MTKPKKRIPKKGDRVAARRQHGTFIVSSVDSDLLTLELRMIGGDLRLIAIPWGALTFVDELDVNFPVVGCFQCVNGGKSDAFVVGLP